MSDVLFSCDDSFRGTREIGGDRVRVQFLWGGTYGHKGINEGGL